MTMTPGAEADRKQGVQCGGQSDGQTEQHIPPPHHTHTTKHLTLERSVKLPNASERKAGENTEQEALRGVGRGPPRGRHHPGHRRPRA